MKKQNILIVGTGALATLFAARLAKIGVHVTMLGTWQAAIDALNRDGARLIEADGQEIAYPVQAVRKCEKANLTIVLVKAWQTERVARQLEKCLSPEGLAVTLQNGVGNYETLASRLGAERVAQGITIMGVSVIAPGLAQIGGVGSVSIETHPRLGALPALLAEAGFQSEVVPSAASLVWSKLVINAAINTLTALLDVPNGELVKRPSARKLMGEIALEAASVAAVQGIPLTFDNPVQTVEKIAEQTGRNYSSMLQDLRRGAPTEIEAICGAIVQAGETHNVATPLNRMMTKLIKARVEST